MPEAFRVEYLRVQSIRQLSDIRALTTERVSTKYKYDLAPVAEQEKTDHEASGAVTNSHLKTFTYDHADRLLSVREKLTVGAVTKEATTVAHRYNVLGQLQSKWLHSDNAVKFRRRTDYVTNIRGWITDGKTVYKVSESGSDLPFNRFSLAYANGGSYTNGNISQMLLGGKDETPLTKGLAFSYDGVNRLTGSTGLSGYADTESGITYYKNGNIQTLSRAGAAVDNLTYNYAGNRLSSINDASGSNTGVKAGSSSYGYDGNGNMTSDGNRGAVMTYNYLNLPKTVAIAGKTLTYDYDAAGTKYKYVADTLTVKYAGGFEYNAANGFTRLGLSEGQAILKNNVIAFQYYVKDHLGNVRVVFDEKGTILQKNDYYPFGLSIDRNSPVQTAASRNAVNTRLYNGKELQVGPGYLDYGARMYMPEIGRWGVVDKEAERYERHSSYSYVLNRPTVAVDPDGRRVYFVGGANNDQDGWNYIQRWGNTFNNAGIADFRRVNMSNGKIGDVMFTSNYRNSGYETIYNNRTVGVGAPVSFSSETRPVENETINKTVAHYQQELKDSPLKEGEQFNLAGYSYGSVLQAQAALKLANSGQVIDNLVLIGSPISDKSDLYKQLTGNKNIKNVLRYDLKGDALSNPQDTYDFIVKGALLQGGVQGNAAPHFDAARPGKEADKLMSTIVQWLQRQGVKN